MSTKAFIVALSRFVSRRGHCHYLNSDNDINFVGARNELAPLYELLEDNTHQQVVHNTLAPEQMQFHFIPPRAPHFCGLWEAAVKSMKYHLAEKSENTIVLTELQKKCKILLPILMERSDKKHV
jgi:hypothetical protein